MILKSKKLIQKNTAINEQKITKFTFDTLSMEQIAQFNLLYANFYYKKKKNWAFEKCFEKIILLAITRISEELQLHFETKNAYIRSVTRQRRLNEIGVHVNTSKAFNPKIQGCFSLFRFNSRPGNRPKNHAAQTYHGRKCDIHYICATVTIITICPIIRNRVTGIPVGWILFFIHPEYLGYSETFGKPRLTCLFYLSVSLHFTNLRFRNIYISYINNKMYWEKKKKQVQFVKYTIL